jgi:hypothetical protein
MTKQMSGHKMKEAAVGDIINIMHKVRVNHINVMHVLHESVGGPQNLSIIEHDVQNRYSHCLKKPCAVLCAKMSDVLIEWLRYKRAAQIHEEVIDDI